MKNTNTTIEKKKKKRGREGRRNSVFFAISAFSLVSSLSSVHVGEAAEACVNPTTASLGLSLNNPKPADLRKDTGCTYNAGTETYVDPGDSTKSKTLTYSPSGSAVSTSAHIYNSFEAGFSKTQDKVIEGWGCSTPSDLYDSAGGLDLGLAESKVRKLCYDSAAWSFPNVQADDSYRGCVGPCGGHTSDYHFHGRYHCLYSQSGAHSTKIGDVGPYIMYGKWEDFENKKLPHLDACGAHIGKTPDRTASAVSAMARTWSPLKNADRYTPSATMPKPKHSRTCRNRTARKKRSSTTAIVRASTPTD